MLPWIIACVVGAVGAVGAALLDSDDSDDKVKGRSIYDDIERKRKEETERNNQNVQVEVQNYQNLEIKRIQNKYNVQIYSKRRGFGFRNMKLQKIELEKQELKKEIKRLQGLKNAFNWNYV